MAIVTLTTDFGGRDGYVGAVKGVLARLAPSATIVDLAHDVPRGDVAHAAWVIACAAFEFPAGTVHLVVVDPGVGGARAELVVEVRGHRFVGPDNGVFGLLGDASGAWAIARAGAPSATFHGRDVFAPAAAALARGAAPASLGPATTPVGASPWGADVVVHVDHYGNLVSNLRVARGARGTVQVGGRALPLVRTYADVAVGEPCAYVGSMGTIEIAVRDGDAARVLGLARGEAVTLVEE